MKNTAIVLLVIALLAAVPFASAAVTPPRTLTAGTSEHRDLGALADQNVSAQGGNVTQVNINVLAITKAWQGYYGNITGEITLDDADNNTFYNWSLAAPKGEVYATRNAAVDFSTIGCANATERTAEETYLGQVLADGDSVTNTFNGTTHPQFNVSTTSVAVNTCFSTNAFVNSAQDASRFFQVLLADGASVIVYTTLIDNDQTGFDGNGYDFELLVGENDHDGSVGSTLYYFFVELT